MPDFLFTCRGIVVNRIVPTMGKNLKLTLHSSVVSSNCPVASHWELRVHWGSFALPKVLEKNPCKCLAWLPFYIVFAGCKFYCFFLSFTHTHSLTPLSIMLSLLFVFSPLTHCLLYLALRSVFSFSLITLFLPFLSLTHTLTRLSITLSLLSFSHSLTHSLSSLPRSLSRSVFSFSLIVLFLPFLSFSLSLTLSLLQVLATAPAHVIWSRTRYSHHGGAIRPYLRPHIPAYGRKGPSYCLMCTSSRSEEGGALPEHTPLDLLDEIDLTSNSPKNSKGKQQGKRKVCVCVCVCVGGGRGGEGVWWYMS